MNLKGARIVLTGAAGGIGAAAAARLAATGAGLILVGRDRGRLDYCARRLEATGAAVMAVAADLTSEAGRRAVVKVAGEWDGGANVLVNNAGVSQFGLLAEEDPAIIERTLLTNALAPMLLCQAMLPVLARQPQAHIVNVGSILGSIALPGNAVYAASKFALRGFSEALRRELADTRIRVHYLAPRATRTALNTAAVAAMNQELGVAMDPPEAVAEALVRLLETERRARYLGWPEKLFVRINAILPGLVDGSLRRQLPVVKRHAARTEPAGHDPGTAARKVIELASGCK